MSAADCHVYVVSREELPAGQPAGDCHSCGGALSEHDKRTSPMVPEPDKAWVIDETVIRFDRDPSTSAVPGYLSTRDEHGNGCRYNLARGGWWRCECGTGTTPGAQTEAGPFDVFYEGPDHITARVHR